MYKPEKELPQDIRSLPQEETKCKFCGVSYLVHHEVKKLEYELQRVQSELIKFYNEKEQLKELPILQSKIEELNNEKEKWADVYRVSKNGMISSLNKIKTSAHNWNKDCLELKQIMKLMIIEQSDRHKEANKVAVRVFETTKQNYRKSMVALDSRVKELEMEIESLNGRVLLERAQFNQMLKEERSSISRRDAELSDLHDMVKVQQDNQRMLELENKELSAENRNLLTKTKEACAQWTGKMDAITSKHTKEKSDLEQKLLERNKTISALQCQLNESISTKQHELEISQLNTNILNLERKHEAELTRHKAELNKLKKQSVLHTSEATDSLRKKMTLDFLKQLKETEDIKNNNTEKIEKIKSDCRQQIKQMNTELSNSKCLFEEKILKLQQELRHEKNINEADVLRHITVEKDLTTRLQHTCDMLETRNKEYKEMHIKINSTEIEAKRIKENCDKITCENENVNIKLQKAYDEISSLQKTVERQCMERTEHMTKLRQSK